jgi:hypothetical protein
MYQDGRFFFFLAARRGPIDLSIRLTIKQIQQPASLRCFPSFKRISALTWDQSAHCNLPYFIQSAKVWIL